MRSTRWRSVAQLMWTLIPVFTMGLGAPIPAIHAALRLRRAATTAAAAFVTLLTGASCVLISLSPRPHSRLSVTLGFLLIGAALAGTAIAASFGREIFDARAVDPGVLPPLARDRSLVVAKSRLRRRKEAAELAESEPTLATDLGIGRPDEPRDFDDGGLVDINHVPADVLTATLALTPEMAAHVVEVREHLGRFDGPDDLVTFAGLAEELVDRVRDRLIAL